MQATPSAGTVGSNGVEVAFLADRSQLTLGSTSAGSNALVLEADMSAIPLDKTEFATVTLTSPTDASVPAVTFRVSATRAGGANPLER
ncbi:hypothetical protein [Ideonella livida]|uniref:Uncharacterized protein n=1 Tax=Ideonella livida TaxID=2707176 RepID=A0A7C9PJU6_9BURK|nr:hypothetical protein [Ideonella livida]NDY93816.1 hypothetical protein [Ideonella livida]